MMLCSDCWHNVARVGHNTCFRCHIHSIGFTFHGGSTDWHGQTVREREDELRYSTFRDNSAVERV